MMISMDNNHHHQDPLGTTNSHRMKSSSSVAPASITLSQSSWLEVRLFYVRIAPCVVDSVPDSLTLAAKPALPSRSTAFAFLPPRRRLLSSAATESTGSPRRRLTSAPRPIEGAWSNNGTVSDPKTGWGLDCYMAMGGNGSSSSSSSSSSSVEVYIAGCCGGVPVILTKTIQASPRRKVARHVTLDSIPEDEEVYKDHDVDVVATGDGRKLHIMKESQVDDESEMKMGDSYYYYPEGMYVDEDGQLSWFNAGVRVGVGIGLGMCLGVGIGVGLLMRSYQATTSNLRRRFL
uniref:Uncharacterized protein n=1 Tax=Brassica oleracea var. oleracea TaxID=109376 RepID=A0A0D3DZE4_BRAOL